MHTAFPPLPLFHGIANSADESESIPSENKFFVYWIRLVDHTDPFLEGYVGITKNIQRRWRTHKLHAEKRECKRNDFPLYQAFRKYGLKLFRFEILAGPLDKWTAHNTEYSLRPHTRIGYNLERGGYWRSCLSCCSLSPRRLVPSGAQLIERHILEVKNYKCISSLPREPEKE